MSYLSSILSSIGGNEQAPKAPSVQPPSRTASPLSRATGTSAHDATPAVAPSSKRKAQDDEQSSSTANKVPRRDAEALTARPAAVASPKLADKPATNGSSSATSVRTSGTGQVVGRPPTKTSASTSVGIGKLSAAAASANAVPKKGSFADIMARAAAAQKASTAKPSLGTIQHKPTEKMSTQEKKARVDQLKNQKPGGRGARSGSRPLSRSQSPEKSKAAVPSMHKLKKTPGDSGYKGTMRPSVPAAPAYRGTMRSGPPLSKPQPKEKGRSSGYVDNSEKEESDEEDDYDDLSDMEAGMDEMDEEEAASLALAKREDLAAKREEERLKREKEQRKRLLQRQ